MTAATATLNTQFGKIRDELFLIGFIILCCGLVYTDSYYQRFGFRYQLLNFSVMHIVYKGLTTTVNSRFMLIPYLLTIAVIFLEFVAVRKKWMLFIEFRTPIIYVFLIVNLFVLYPLSAKAGYDQALLDMHGNTTELPRIEKLVSTPLTISKPGDNYVLFLVDADFVTVFTPLDSGDNYSVPIIKRIPKKDVQLLETSY
jgi:hypothetical protein